MALRETGGDRSTRLRASWRAIQQARSTSVDPHLLRRQLDHLPVLPLHVLHELLLAVVHHPLLLEVLDPACRTVVVEPLVLLGTVLLDRGLLFGVEGVHDADLVETLEILVPGLPALLPGAPVVRMVLLFLLFAEPPHVSRWCCCCLRCCWGDWPSPRFHFTPLDPTPSPPAPCRVPRERQPGT